jgi:sec-independent protein translocase protein TatA
MPFNIQGPELILILIIALIVIGPGKLPDVGAALGRSIREFRKAATDVKDATSLEPKTSTAPPVPVARVETPPVVTPTSETAEAVVPGAVPSKDEEPKA